MAVSLVTDHTGHGQVSPAFARQYLGAAHRDEESDVTQPPFSALVHNAPGRDAPEGSGATEETVAEQSDETRSNHAATSHYGPGRVLGPDEKAALARVEMPRGNGNTAPTEGAAAGSATIEASVGSQSRARMVRSDPVQRASLPEQSQLTAHGSAIFGDQHARSPAFMDERSALHVGPLRTWLPVRDVRGDPGRGQATHGLPAKAPPPDVQAQLPTSAMQSRPGQVIAAFRQPSSHRFDTADKTQADNSRTGPVVSAGLSLADEPRAEPNRAQPIVTQPGAAADGVIRTRSFFPIAETASETGVSPAKFSSPRPKARIDSAQHANGPFPQTFLKRPALAEARTAAEGGGSGPTVIATETVIAPVGDEDVNSMPLSRNEVIPLAVGVSPTMSAISAHPAIWSIVGKIRQMIADNQAALADARSVDLDLVTQELGRLKLSLAAHDGTMSIHLQTDRPDTIDLFRRHGDILAAALQDIGYDAIDFSFSNEENATARDEARDETASSAPSPHREALEPIHVVTDAAQPSAPRGDRVDLMM